MVAMRVNVCTDAKYGSRLFLSLQNINTQYLISENILTFHAQVGANLLQISIGKYSPKRGVWLWSAGLGYSWILLSEITDPDALYYSRQEQLEKCFLKPANSQYGVYGGDCYIERAAMLSVGAEMIHCARS